MENRSDFNCIWTMGVIRSSYSPAVLRGNFEHIKIFNASYFYWVSNKKNPSSVKTTGRDDTIRSGEWGLRAGWN